MNNFVLTGTITKEVEVKKSKNNKDYAIIDLKVDPRFKDSNYYEDGRVIVFYEKAHEVKKEMKIGSRVQLEGYIKFKNGLPDSLVLLNYFVDQHKSNFFGNVEQKENVADDVNPFEDDF